MLTLLVDVILVQTLFFEYNVLLYRCVGYGYRVRYISIGAGSKNLLQVSLQLFNNLPPALMHFIRRVYHLAKVLWKSVSGMLLWAFTVAA